MILEHGLRRSARLWPDKVAAIDGDHRVTYAQFAERVNRLANALRDLGLRPGDRVGALMLNSFRYLELYYAINGAGGVIVPMNTRLAVPELAFMLDDCASATLFITREFIGAAGRLQQQCPALATVILAEDEDAPAGMLSYEALLAAASPEHPGIAATEGDLAGIFYTGGTMGLPKGVMLSHRNLIDNMNRVIIHLDIRQDEIYLHAAPMFHLADAGAAFYVTAVGATHAHARTFEPVAVLGTIARERVTAAVLVPTMITALINRPDIAAYDLSSLRNVIYGAAPIAETTLRRAMEIFGCDFRQGYGMTEAAPLLTVLSAADHRLDGSERALRRLRSVGQPCIGIELRVVNDDDREVPPGTVGEIIARGANIMMGYWNRPEETAAALRDGWYHSGDLATIDEGGYVTIVDRKKDMIISGGENIYSIEVENALAGHPSVLEVAVIGVPDDRWGEAVWAIAVARPGHSPSAEELIAHCRGRIAGYKVPKAVAFAEVLPKSGAGKILKREIREPYWREHDRRVH